ncbi:MAG: chromate transporter [Bacilli bacterium]|nr:chromate transporter [Bacilli bacterium]
MMKNIWILMKTFFKVGLFTFGGGLAMLPIIEREVVEKYGWLKPEEMTDLIAIAESTPGPIAVNTATFVGYKVGKFAGAIMSTLSLVFPSLVIITVISFFVDEFLALEYVNYAFMGIRCAVGLLIFLAAVKIFKGNKKYWYTYVLLALAMLIMLLLPNLSTIYIIIGGGVVGLIINLISFKTNKKVEGDNNA